MLSNLIEYPFFKNDSQLGGDVPDECRQAYISRVLKKVKNMMMLIIDRCRSHASAAKP